VELNLGSPRFGLACYTQNYSKSHISLYFLPALTAESSLSQCKFLPLPMVISTASPLWNLLWEFTIDSSFYTAGQNHPH
ncbi:MAG: hypothetical protein IKH21_04415, partial [Clostridia bacterium]|nr:hypothetical protein [Clostridia bacterium]